MNSLTRLFTASSVSRAARGECIGRVHEGSYDEWNKYFKPTKTHTGEEDSYFLRVIFFLLHENFLFTKQNLVDSHLTQVQDSYSNFVRYSFSMFVCREI